MGPWDAAEYRKRAKAWREKAASLSEDQPERTLWLEVADGYEKLATQIEQLVGQRNQKCPGDDR
jgi:hypothetical protein